MKIAFVVDMLHASSGGGILSGNNVVDRLRREHDVVTIASDGDVRLRSFQLPFQAMRQTGFVMAKPNRELLRNALADRDVVHLQFPFWLSLAALAEARALGKPVVAAFHIQPENLLLNVGIHSVRANDALYRLAINHLYSRVDAVVCPTPFAEQKLRSHGLRTPTFVVSNGVSPDVAKATATMGEHPQGNSGTFFILAVGRLAEEKRQDVIIEAVRQSRHRDRIRLVLSGEGPRGDELRRLAESLPRGAEIGFLPREKLLQYFAEADLFVHASEVELEGMAVLEAMSEGLPVLVAQAPESAASAFALDDDFRFPAGDAATLSARIDALIEDRQKLRSAGVAYRKRAHTFDFERSVDRLVDVYRTVLGQGGRGLRRSA